MFWLKHYLNSITETQTKSKVQPDSVTDDFYRKAMVLILRGSGLYLHAGTLLHPLRAQQVDDVFPLYSLTAMLLPGSQAQQGRVGDGAEVDPPQAVYEGWGRPALFLPPFLL